MASNRSNKVKFFVAGLLFVVAAVGVFCLLKYTNLLVGSQEKIEQEWIKSLDLSTAPISEKDRADYTVETNRPRYLHIPSIGVEQARVLALGVLKPNEAGDQQMDAPKNTNDVGWYDCQINPIAEKRCSKPMLPGSGDTEYAAVLDGHTCFARNLTCVFDNLKKLKVNDTITIERGDGSKINYAVRKVEVLNLADVDMSKAIRPIEPGKEGLTLITCTGKYQGVTDNNGVQTASQRVLVYATRE